jgi:hypothetical protein
MTTAEDIPARLEVRLDIQTRRKLAELKNMDGRSLSEITRQSIDLAYEQRTRERRIAAARRLGELEVEQMPDPDELAKQMNDRYGPLP